MYTSTIAATVLAMASAALAAPAPQITSGPNAPYPGTDKYVVKNFSATVGRMSEISQFSMDITTNENGYTPFMTHCAGSQSTQPVLTYLNETACTDSAVVISWGTVQPDKAHPGARYALSIKDARGHGSREWKWDVVKQARSSPNDQFPGYYVDLGSDEFEVDRVEGSAPTVSQ